MKQLGSILCISILLLLFIGGGCGYDAYKVVTGTVNGQFSTANYQFFRWCFNGLPFVDKLPALLDNKTYLVLLQNNTELRPSGGFLGSYAKIETAPSGIKNISVQDIYVPDGQLVGHVDPPLPIEQAFGQGWWKLRDSNWDPDFKIAAEQMAWFFNQGGEKADGIIAVNLDLVTKWLEVIGPVKPLDYPETVTSKNFTSLAQKYSEQNAFPGSTQKKDFLGAVGRVMIVKSKQTGAKQLLQLAKLVFQQLKTKQMLVWFANPDLEKIAHQRDWTGELGDFTGNYLYLVETNLGANKANCCIERAVYQTIDGASQELHINWGNNNQFTNPVKPYFWGGDYIDYVRVILPSGAKIRKITVADKPLVKKELENQYGLQQDRYQIEDRDKYKIIGFWTKVPAQKSSSALIDYELPVSNSILVKHQPGMGQYFYGLVVDGTIRVKELLVDRDVNIGPWTKQKKSNRKLI